MVKTEDKQTGTLTREKICQYVWAVYIDNNKAPFAIDEEEAIHFFEKLYSKYPMNQDEECFYYGILLYEQAFSADNNRARYLVKAKDVFQCYRDMTGETEWEPIEDRYADVSDLIKTENLLDKVKTLDDLAPEIPGMVLVPSGPFPFGEDNVETVLEPYYIDIYPITVKQYKVFLEETNYRTPVLWERRPELTADELPVTGVSWMDALQYCKWSKKSLPTAEQWEKACRGTEGYAYPWGNDAPTPDRANFRDIAQQPQLLAVNLYDGFPSPYGVKTMVGSVWEWTNSAWIDEEGAQIIKGGSWVDPPDPAYMSATATLWANKKIKTDVLGFRCTKGLEGV